MKVELVIWLLQKYSDPKDEVFIQWWTHKDVESAMGDVSISDEVFTKAVEIWDNEPIGARDAGVLDCVFAAKDVIKERRKKENAEKFRIITGGI